MSTEACFREGLELFRRMGHALAVAQALAGLGRLAYDKGELDRAVRHFREGLELTTGLGIRSSPTTLGDRCSNGSGEA